MCSNFTQAQKYICCKMKRELKWVFYEPRFRERMSISLSFRIKKIEVDGTVLARLTFTKEQLFGFLANCNEEEPIVSHTSVNTDSIR